MRHPYLDHPYPIPFAHRGGDESSTENSIEAFADAVSLGFRYLETDCHATADGVLVAFHDDRLDRVSDETGRVADKTWNELSRVKLAKGGRVVRLDDLLAVWSDTRFNIDPKSDAAAELLPDVLRKVRFGLDRLCIGSFSDARLARLRIRLGPGLCTSMGPKEVLRLRVQSYGVPRILGSFKARCVQVPVRQGLIPVADELFIRRAHRLGLHVHVWTVNDPSEMRRLLDLGVDGLVTDRPRVLKRVLHERAQWAA
ncbi:MAG: glycerophosphodiester phosphodiesterase [Myxococcota bacterium]